MIIDIHTRIWESTRPLGLAAEVLRRRCPDPWARLDASRTAHAAAMGPVQYAIIHGFESRLLGAHITAEQVATWIGEDRSRLLGFAGIDPLVSRSVHRMEEAISCGLVGLTISPSAAGFHPAHTRAMDLYEACADRQIPILVEYHPWLVPAAKMEFAQPYLWDEVVRTFPELKLVISSLGHPWMEQTFSLMAKHRCVYADVSEMSQFPMQLYQALLSALHQGVLDQILFGSGFPVGDPESAILNLYSMNNLNQGTPLPTVGRHHLRSIVERDALSCLGLARPSNSSREKAIGQGESPGSSWHRIAGDESDTRVVETEESYIREPPVDRD